MPTSDCPENYSGTSLSRKCGECIVVASNLQYVSICPVTFVSRLFFEDWRVRNKGCARPAGCGWRQGPKTIESKRPSDEGDCRKQAVLFRVAQSKLEGEKLNRQPWIRVGVRGRK